MTWDDARASAADTVDATTIDSVHRPYPVVTIGWLLRDDSMGVSVCNECVDGETYRGHTFIPRALVREVAVLRKAAKVSEGA